MKILLFDQCNCDQSIALEKRVHELELLIETMNCGKPIDYDEPPTGIVKQLYPVQQAKWEHDKVRLEKHEKWLAIACTWLSNAESKIKRLEGE